MSDQQLAREVSWTRVVMLVAIVLISSPAFVWAVNNAGHPTAEISRLTGTTLIFFTTVDYAIHLLKYNSLVKQRFRWLLSVFGIEPSGGDPDA